MKIMKFFICSLLTLLMVNDGYAQLPIIINKYAAVLDYNPCTNALIVDSTTGFAVGDTVLMIQMKGATIDSSNTISFGNIFSYNSCGNYEYNIISSIIGNNVELQNTILRAYQIPQGKVQLVRVPSYSNYMLTQPHTCMAWNGTKGGVYSIIVQNTLSMLYNIDVTGKGFRGGISNPNPTLLSPACTPLPVSYCMAPDYGLANSKGEGIAEVEVNKSFGIGKLANGGGSGFSQNSGGGGGSNNGIGGQGGQEYVGCNNNPANNTKGGIGGLHLNYTNTANKVYLGGGGGSGHVNNINLSNGGSGGGLCFITAGTIVGGNSSIIANGQNGLQCTNNGSFGSCHDGMAGGGGAGAVLLKCSNATGLNISAKGGKGADENGNAGYLQVGPGGGGGGGAIWYSTSSVLSNTAPSVSGGANGIVAYSGESWGAFPGQPGELLFNLNMPFADAVFVNANANFDSLRTQCFTFNFTDQSSTQSGSITGYSWNFGDGSATSSQQNPTHTFPTYGSYNVTLTIATSEGCTANVMKTINIPYVDFLVTTGDTVICSEASVQLHASGGGNYTWTPTTGLNDSTIADPVATISNGIVYKVNATDAFGCPDTDSVTITFKPSTDAFITPGDAKICGNGNIQLNVTGIDDPVWVPASGLNNASIPNPVASPAQTTTYIVRGNANNGCEGSDTITIYVYPSPSVIATATNDTVNCNNPDIQLDATGAQFYQWSPASILDNPGQSSTVAHLKQNINFSVVGTDINGCTDTANVFVYYGENKLYFIPNSFSPNGDGVNEIFIPVYYCNFLLSRFNVYNRFGERVFTTNNLNTGWNGTQKGKPAELGTYFWYIDGKTTSGQTITRKGDVTLIR